MTRSHVCDGLRVLWDGGVADVPLRYLMRNVWLNFTIMPTTAYHETSYLRHTVGLSWIKHYSKP